jgi:hypothetical protein
MENIASYSLGDLEKKDIYNYLNCYLIDKSIRPAFLPSNDDITKCDEIISRHFPDLTLLQFTNPPSNFLIIRRDTLDELSQNTMDSLLDSSDPGHDTVLGEMLGYYCPGEQIIALPGRVSFGYFVINPRDNLTIQLFAYVCNGIKYLDKAIERLNDIKRVFSEDKNINSMNLEVGLSIKYLRDIYPRTSSSALIVGGRKSRRKQRKQRNTRRKKHINKNKNK